MSKANSKTARSNQPAPGKPESAAPPACPSGATLLARVDPELAGLPERQRTPLAALAAGRGFGEAARSAGVSRQTLRNWRNKDVRFAAVFNAWHSEAFASARHRLICIADDAVTTIGDAIHTGDARIAMELVRRLGLLTPITPGPEDPAELRRDNLRSSLFGHSSFGHSSFGH
jgi:hypothetical protein